MGYLTKKTTCLQKWNALLPGITFAEILLQRVSLPQLTSFLGVASETFYRVLVKMFY
jgi:hypothetical protein